MVTFDRRLDLQQFGVRDVASAAMRSCAVFARTHAAASIVSRRPSKTNTGARRMRASSTRAVQPPARVISWAPRLYDATSAASVVASGT
jgi:hypothetical protein